MGGDYFVCPNCEEVGCLWGCGSVCCVNCDEWICSRCGNEDKEINDDIRPISHKIHNLCFLCTDDVDLLNHKKNHFENLIKQINELLTEAESK